MKEFLENLQYIFIEKGGYKEILKGLEFTIELTILATILGITLGIILALMQISHFYPIKNSKFNPLSKLAYFYVDVIRGTPAIIQLMLLSNLLFIGALKDTPKLITATIAFGLNSSAYVAEIIRAGIEGLDKGQMEAGRALGMSYSLTMKVIIIPQAIKKILPTLVSEFIILLKETSVVGFIGGIDLLRSARIIISKTHRAIEPLIVVALIYLLLTVMFTKVMRMVERRLKESD